MQTEQEWAIKLKRAEDERQRQLAAKDTDIARLREQHAQELATKDADTEGKVQQAKAEEVAALERAAAAHAAALAAREAAFKEEQRRAQVWAAALRSKSSVCGCCWCVIVLGADICIAESDRVHALHCGSSVVH